MDQKPEKRGEPMPDPVILPIGIAELKPSNLNWRQRLWINQPSSPAPAYGSCGLMARRAIDIGTFRTRIAPMADYDLEALSLPELKKMQKDIAKAISTY